MTEAPKPQPALKPQPSLLLSNTDLVALMRPADYLSAVERGFLALRDGRAVSSPPMHVEARGGAFHAKAASLAGERDYVALKLNGNFPANPRAGLPTIQGAILLCDADTGAVLAIMDSIEITLRRTAAATALAARHLAKPGATSVAICGCGAQAPAQLEALLDVLPLTHGFAWDIEPGRALTFAAQSSERFGVALVSFHRGGAMVWITEDKVELGIDCVGKFPLQQRPVRQRQPKLAVVAQIAHRALGDTPSDITHRVTLARNSLYLRSYLQLSKPPAAQCFLHRSLVLRSALAPIQN